MFKNHGSYYNYCQCREYCVILPYGNQHTTLVPNKLTTSQISLITQPSSKKRRKRWDLNADAKRPVFIIPWLITDNHPWLQTCHVPKPCTHTLRPFVHIQCCSHSMTRSWTPKNKRQSSIIEMAFWTSIDTNKEFVEYLNYLILQDNFPSFHWYIFNSF